MVLEMATGHSSFTLYVRHAPGSHQQSAPGGGGRCRARRVRRALTSPAQDSEHFYLYDDDERSELLFRLLKHLAVGGSMCQWDDDMGPYLQLAWLT